MSLFLNRSKRAGRFLEWKVRIFTVGAAVALVGLYLGERWITGVAIGVLAVGMVLAVLPGARLDDDAEDADEDPEAASGE